MKTSQSSLQMVIDMELHNKHTNQNAGSYWTFRTDQNFVTNLRKVCKNHLLNVNNFKDNKNNTSITPSDLIIKKTSGKYLIKIVETCLETTSTTSKVDESDLKIIFILSIYPISY